MPPSKLFEVLSRDSCRIKVRMWWVLSIGRSLNRLNTVLILSGLIMFHLSIMGFLGVRLRSINTLCKNIKIDVGMGDFLGALC